ncbi:MAG: hypothetical protein MUO50_06870 [Longimicrobiales bacterium]|nr:hypothetical protein [Longimicrobiales bacterium]
MESWTERIENILDRAPTRAMSFSRLVGTLREEGLPVAGREDWILQRVVEQPKTFKVIPDRLGPWVLWPRKRGAEISAPCSETPRCDPWIMTCSAASPSLGIEREVVARIQESLQAWGREIDDGSQVAVARWIGANTEAEEALGSVLSAVTGRARMPRSTNHPLRPPPGG